METDENPLFTPFQPAAPPAEEPTRRRGPRKKIQPAGTEAPAAPKKRGRPPGRKGIPSGIVKPASRANGEAKPALRPRKAHTVKLDMGTAFAIAGALSEDESRFLGSVVQAMQPFSKKSRGKIVAALGKVFE